MIKVISLLIIFVLSNNALKADSTFTKNSSKPLKTTIMQDIGNDLKYFATDWGAYFYEPFRPKKNLLISSAVVGGTILISTADKEVKKEISVQGTGTYNGNFLDGPTAYGYVQYPSIFGGAL